MRLTPSIVAALRASGHRVVVTGASGWLGRATLDLLGDALGDEFAARVVCFGSRRAQLSLPDGTAIAQHPLAAIGDLPHRPTLLLHFAFLGKERAEAMDEAAYTAANRAIRATVLGAIDTIGVEAVFVASSGAARFADDPAASPAMRLYGSLKREDEHAFVAWAEAAGSGAAVARIFNVSGPHINKLPSYALSSFILDALAGRPIAIKARHDVLRGYVAVRELMSLVFALLLERGVTRFDSGGEPIELGDLAAHVAAQFGCRVERPVLRETRADTYLGDQAKYQRLLARHGIAPVPLADQIRETAAFLECTGASVPQVAHA